MKKTVLIFTALITLVLMGGTPAYSGDASTKYPIVLAHGMGATAQNFGIIDYWGSIDNELKSNGAVVYKTAVNGMDGTRAKAISFKKQVMNILADSKAEKINIIAHSHGTLYTRDAITNLGLAKYVASHTSIAGPHQGSRLADVIYKGVPDVLKPVTGKSLDLLYSFFLGDKNPDSLKNALDITTFYMKDVFNKNTPNVSGIYYQSWAGKGKIGCPSIVLQPAWLIMLALEGANDGLVGVESAKWGNFRGVKSGAFYSPGVDHFNLVDQLFGFTPGFDAPDFYVDIAQELKGMKY